MYLMLVAEIYYRPQGSCGKVMFLHLPVILFIGGGFSVQGFSVQGGSMPRGSLSGRSPLSPYGYVRAVRILLECSLNLSFFEIKKAIFLN